MPNPNLPPEVISEQLHDGVGAASMRDAAVAWGGMAERLDTAAQSLRRAVLQTGEHWQGPAATSMTVETMSCAEVLGANADAARRTEISVNEMAVAFETARAAVVPPQEVAGNRAALAELISTDVLGLNGPAIATTEGAYHRMREQNTAAMAAYHREASAAAQQLGEWQPPQQALPAANPLLTARDHQQRAAELRELAVAEAVATQTALAAYDRYRDHAGLEEHLARHNNALARHYQNLVGLHRNLAQHHKDVHLGQSDVHALTEKYNNLNLSEKWEQALEQRIEMWGTYGDARRAMPRHPTYLGFSWGVDLLDVMKMNYAGYLDWTQGPYQDPASGRVWECHELKALRHENMIDNLHVEIGFLQQDAHRHTVEAQNAWRAVHESQERMNRHIVNLISWPQLANEHDRIAAELETRVNAHIDASGR